MYIFMFILTIWVVGLVITLVHELGHALSSGGVIEYIQIGIPIGTPVVIGKFRIFPLFPVGGETKLTLVNPTKEKVVIFILTGIVAGLIACVLVGILGICLLPSETVTEIIRSHHMRFLLKEIIAGTATAQTTIATAFITSTILFGVQQIGNLIPLRGYDGYQLLRTQSHINQTIKFE